MRIVARQHASSMRARGLASAVGLVVLAFATTLGSSIGCANETNPDRGDGTELGVSQLEVPLYVSLAGAESAVGKQEKQGAELAVQQLNALGGVLGQQIKLRVIDIASDPQLALKQVNESIAAGVPYGIGPTGSPPAAALRDLIRNSKVLLISASSASSEFDNPVVVPGAPAAPAPESAPFFRVAPSERLLASAVSLFANGGGTSELAPSACRALAIVYVDDDYGRPLSAKIESALRFSNKGIVGGARFRITRATQSAATDETLARTVLDKVVERSQVFGDGARQCQVVVGQAEQAASYIRAFRKVVGSSAAYQPFAKMVILGSDGLADQAFLDKGRENPGDPQSASFVDGLYVAAGQPAGKPTARTPVGYAPFYNGFVAAYGSAPNRYAAYAYDSVILLALALEKSGGSTDIGTLRRALLGVAKGGTSYSANRLDEALVFLRAGGDLDYAGASGPVDFDAVGEVTADIVVSRIEQNAFVEKASYQPQ